MQLLQTDQNTRARHALTCRLARRFGTIDVDRGTSLPWARATTANPNYMSSQPCDQSPAKRHCQHYADRRRVVRNLSLPVSVVVYTAVTITPDIQHLITGSTRCTTMPPCVCSHQRHYVSPNPHFTFGG